MARSVVITQNEVKLKDLSSILNNLSLDDHKRYNRERREAKISL